MAALSRERLHLGTDTHVQSFFKTFCWTHVLFTGPLTPLFWNSGDVSSGFQIKSVEPYLHLAEVCLINIP